MLNSEFLKSTKVKKLKDIMDVDLDLEVRGLTDDSRRVEKGFLFFCIKGTEHDGHDFAHEAVDRGACAIVAQKKLKVGVPVIVVEDTKKAAYHALSSFYDNPQNDLLKIAVTGTNGKTTVSHIIWFVNNKIGNPFSMIGTVNHVISGEKIKANNTTPGIFEFFYYMFKMKLKNNVGFVAEVSSHALDQKRLVDLCFDFSIFTNLSRDHLDYHGSMENYYMAKRRLFTEHTCGISIINCDDLWGKRLIKDVGKDVLKYGTSGDADIKGRVVEVESSGMTVVVDGYKIKTRLLGFHNLYNIMAAYAVFAVWSRQKDFVKALEDFEGVEGRLERIKTKDFEVFIDYAHTPDALRTVLVAIRPCVKGRLILVFGCGGDRDRGKRPEMGAIASELADYIIVTSDNPRNEDPEAIIKDILAGVKVKDYEVIVDRRNAIERALGMAKTGDVVLIAGKGHEDYQIIGSKRIHFSDREVVCEVLGLKRQ